MTGRIFCIIATIVGWGSVPPAWTAPPPALLLIAHRGGVVAEDRIENSLPAIEAAIDRGYFMLEVDLRESRDGQLVVHHDADFTRFYGDPRHVAQMDWSAIQQLRSQVGNLSPMDFASFCGACAGRIRLMLDTKGDHDERFFARMQSILIEHGLLDSALVIGTEQSKRFFHGKAKIGLNPKELAQAVASEEPVSELYFLFVHGNVSEESVRLAQHHRVTVIPSINTFHYPRQEHATQAARDIRRLKALGVRHFQIDSTYETACREERRFSAPEAVQGVAVDHAHIYAIANRQIGKYRKEDGVMVDRWKAHDDVPLSHLNSGIVLDGKLYCAHSNYPQQPSTSSVEIWNANSLRHIDSHSLGIFEGSLTWIDWHDDAWWATFAHYSNPLQMVAGRQDHRWTSLVRFDKEWRRTGGWAFPPEVLRQFSPFSCSGGTWGNDGFLYCSGHDRQEIYRLSLPRSGATLRLDATLPCPITGQGFAWDRGSPGLLYGIDRPKREIITVNLQPPPQPHSDVEHPKRERTVVD